MVNKPIDQITDVDVKVNEVAGLKLNDHSGVVELAVRCTDTRTLSCGCCTESVDTYTTVPIDKMDLARILDGFGELKAEYNTEHLEESLAWFIKFDRHKDD